MLNKLNIKEVSIQDTSFNHIFTKILYISIIFSVLIFILWPILSVLFQSIYPEGKLDFVMYKNLFTENKELLLNSIFVSVLSSVIAVSFGLIIALYISHSNNNFKGFITGIILLTMISPPFVSSMVYMMLFGRRGLITYKLLGLNINPYGWQGVVIVQGLAHISLSALIIMAALKGVNRNLEYASLDSGASSFKTLINITIPLAKPGIMAALLISFIKSISDFGTPIIIGGSFKVLASQAYLNVVGLYNFPKAAAMSSLLLLPALAVFVVYRRLIEKKDIFSNKIKSADNTEIQLSNWLNFLIGIMTWTFVIIMLIKYITIFWGTFARTWGIDFSFSLRHIRKIKSSSIESYIRSLKYALIAGTAGSFIGLIFSYLMERKNFIGKNVLDFISNLPYMIPGTFFGIGYLLAFHGPPLALTGTGFIIIVNCIFRQLPITIRAGSAILKQLNPELEDSSRDLGAKGIYVFKDIILPNLKPAFLISFVNTFTTTMTTIGAVIFLVSPGSKVATVVLFDAIKEGNIGEGTAMASLLIITVLTINSFFIWYFTKSNDKENREIKGENYVSALKRIN